MIEGAIVFLHAGLAVLMLLYLLVRIIVALFNRRDEHRRQVLLRRFRYPDWFLMILIGITGLYPAVLLGRMELYHWLKLIMLGVMVWLLRFSFIRLSGSGGLSVLLLVLMGYLSVTDQPTFPRSVGAFEAQHPEIVELPEVERGKFIFSKLCAQCHGDDGRLGRFQAADLTDSRLSPEGKRAMILNGSPLTVMPPFREVLSDEEVEWVMAYIRDLNEE